MEYHGKLYGKIGNKYFYTGRTSEDYDKLLSERTEMLEMLQYFVKENMLSIVGEEMAIELIKKATEI